jgi:hypothetical protein
MAGGNFLRGESLARTKNWHIKNEGRPRVGGRPCVNVTVAL